MPFGRLTLVGPRNHVLDGAQRFPHTGRGTFEGGYVPDLCLANVLAQHMQQTKIHLAPQGVT